MDFPTINEPEDRFQQQLESLDKTIATAEAMLKDADEAITKAIRQRGKLAEDVQHLWIKRHNLNQEFEAIREDTRKLPYGFPR